MKPGYFDFFKTFFPPNNPYIKYVTINSIAQKEMERRTGISSSIISDCFDFSEKNFLVDEYARNFRKDFGIAENDIVFLQATRIVQRKQIELAVELIERLKNPKVVFVLSGYSGDEGNEYFFKIKNMINAAGVKARFLGDRVGDRREVIDGIRHYSLWDCYINCDFVTYPSQFEGFGNQFIEAVAFKKPVFVNRYDVFKSDIEPLGFDVIKVDSVVTDEAVAKVSNLLKDPQKISEVVDKNYEIGEQHFSYEATMKKIENLGIEPLVPNLYTEAKVSSSQVFKSQTFR